MIVFLRRVPRHSLATYIYKDYEHCRDVEAISNRVEVLVYTYEYYKVLI